MDILISGVGGQGIVLASKILADAAIDSGNSVRTGETIGMSQRGGCVVSHVRIGDSSSPYISHGGADLLLAFELCEGARNIPQLKKGATAIVNNSKIMPVSVSLGASEYDHKAMTEYISSNSKAFFVDANKTAAECGSVKAVNLVLIGAAYGLSLIDIPEKYIIEAIKKNISERFVRLNTDAFKAGMVLIGGCKNV